MNMLDRFILDPIKTVDYVLDNLEGTNCLSSAVCDSVEFGDGIFYTFLPKNATNQQVYGFKWGGIGGDVREKIVSMISSMLIHNANLICIFDDVDGTYRPSYNEESFLQSGVYFGDQIYYLIDDKNCSKDFLIECFRTSNAYWHSLCVLSSVKFSRPKDCSISESEMISFAKGAQMIFFGAYDGEGYIIWERNSYAERGSKIGNFQIRNPQI